MVVVSHETIFVYGLAVVVSRLMVDYYRLAIVVYCDKKYYCRVTVDEDYDAGEHDEERSDDAFRGDFAGDGGGNNGLSVFAQPLDLGLHGLHDAVNARRLPV